MPKASVLACSLLIVFTFAPQTWRTAQAFELTGEERQHLAKLSPLTYCVDPDWMPFGRITPQGRHEGIVADFIQQFSELLQAPLRLQPTESWAESLQLVQQGECDLIPALNASPNRAKYLNFTEPYISSAVVLVARSDSEYLSGFPALNGKTLGIVKGYIFEELIQRNYPGIRLIYVPSVRDAFLQVSQGKLDATVSSLLEATRHIQQEGLSNLKIAGETDFVHQLRVGIRKDDPLLATIFQRLISSFPPELSNQIMRRWFSVKLERQVNYKIILQLLAVCSLILGFLVYRNRTIARFNQQLAKANDRLKERNKRLEKLSQRDSLTATSNRLKVCTELQHQLEHRNNYNSPLTVTLVDVDRFRQINLDFGHSVGDQVLIEVAQLIADQLNDWDRLGRWEGDSFLILSPDTTLEDGQALADKLERLSSQQSFYEGATLQLTCCCQPSQPGESLAQLTDRLERAMAQRKEEKLAAVD
ncbi:diguanylate cyclase domain-containing protein [Marinobacterium arenosum]|uniref:diguanylate cyclase domain-containing protein n=1 Tax=Marinobacterium arenosum TaxID=2862496 RepID=UPI001C943059|nr:transporter substrate-binding domain-containing protein [Marinobacterium arenosum]MBY4675744.1 transporter substrate-binding domain-containing protein [Marinobacterium arenosum]